MTGLDKRRSEGGEPRPDPGSIPYLPGLPGRPGTGQPGTGQPGTGQPGTGQPGSGQGGTAPSPSPSPSPGTTPLTAPTASGAGAVPMTLHGSPGDVTVRVEGRITIEDAVLEKIAALAALEVAGVVGPAPAGTRVAVDKDDVTIHLAIAVEYGSVIKDVAHAVQENVARVTGLMLGVRVAAVNVSVGDVRLRSAPPRPRSGMSGTGHDGAGQSGPGQSGPGQTARA
ncbi:Asp23/Gls24 family envelope stress response protein [Actinomadura chokoriensis]|uniref:Asp23/Gls24 family envelope stress response protein n=1 Tax=Actinomadura chokoriensis TaxID=454156 RepID=A0ABV4R8D9_9ACTN